MEQVSFSLDILAESKVLAILTDKNSLQSTTAFMMNMMNMMILLTIKLMPSTFPKSAKIRRQTNNLSFYDDALVTS